MLTGNPIMPRALMVYHANPLASNANTNRVHRALDRLDFIVVIDIFMSKTAEMADLVLPDTSFLERFDYRTYPSAKGVVVALRQPAVEPICESRSFYDVELALARRMGYWDTYPWHSVEEFFAYALSPVELDLPSLLANPVQIVARHAYRKYEKGWMRLDGQPGLNTPSGKVELYSSVYAKLSYDPLPTYVEPAEAGANSPIARVYPLVGVNRRSATYVHFKYRNNPFLRDLEPEPFVRLNPKDASVRGIASGDCAVISSPRGEIRMKALVTERTQPGIAWIDGGWGNAWDQSDANLNVLVDDVQRDPISQSAAISSFRCQVRKE